CSSSGGAVGVESRVCDCGGDRVARYFKHCVCKGGGCVQLFLLWGHSWRCSEGVGICPSCCSCV
ncbi:UNVERIFIED_CONTAM: hypothetical protein HDU68_003358, partial [Siphonaria sp. JEL0065]